MAKAKARATAAEANASAKPRAKAVFDHWHQQAAAQAISFQGPYLKSFSKGQKPYIGLLYKARQGKAKNLHI